MVNKIQVLLENRGYVGNSDDGEAVVSLIEELGMLPPYSEKMFQECMKNNKRNGGRIWEPEDE